MIKYIFLILISFNIAFSQSYNDILRNIIKNNLEIKAYREQLNSIKFESKTGLLPQNPSIEYSYLSGIGLIPGNKQELTISQPFEFPSIYFLKSDIASYQIKYYENKFKELMLQVFENAQDILMNYIYQTKLVAELEQRSISSENMLNTIQTRFDAGDVGILELNKVKSSYSVDKTKLNIAKLNLRSFKFELINLNGGESFEINLNEYFQVELISNFDSLFLKIKDLDNYLNTLIYEEKLFDKKLSLAKSGWLPNFDIGYRYENEPEFEYRGIQLQMSIPLFENSNKVPKALSDINFINLNKQSYLSGLSIKKKILFEKSIELKKSMDEQKELIDFSQLELNEKSYKLGHISLTQYYLDNQLYYEILDNILINELEYYKTISNLYSQIIFSEIIN
ncbi:MAG: hypothetical protein A2X64_09585 [Ignavibacteria bacterium GWF2_33_9]|nr:MAG: hypothetical protein A2X64_09585 [Ignavibacteria bacterium GWF2_33_9]